MSIAPHRTLARWTAVVTAVVGALHASPGRADAPGPPARVRTLDVAEFRVMGASHLTDEQVQAALEPFLGPGRVLQDIEAARAALEKAYADRGYPAVTVSIPQQTVREGVVTLQVVEGKVSRLRVTGARWFLPSEIRRLTPSVAEGSVPNFDAIARDMYEVNQWPDRKITPSLRAGPVPGSILVDLDVQDTLPLHGSLEVNDRYSPGTTPTRLSGSLRYDNLLQLGHSLALSYQTAPQRKEDGQVFSGSYLARFPGASGFTLTASAIVSDSDVSTLGGTTVVGKGRFYGVRSTFTLDASTSWFQTVALGLDYKHSLEDIAHAPYAVDYWPLTVQYSAAWQGEESRMQILAGASFGIRPLGSGPDAFDAKRYRASASFFSMRLDVNRSDPLPGLLEIYGRVLAQTASDPLLGPEQMAIGGADTVRGYVEAQAIGDEALLGQVELRGPSLSRWFGGRWIDDLRVLAFADAARAVVLAPLPEQRSGVTLVGMGAGMRMKLLGHVSGVLDLGFPMTAPEGGGRGPGRLHFRVWSDF